MEQYMPIVWIGFAIFMLLCEGFTTQLVSIWFVLGSVCAAITTIFTSDITIQSAVFLVVSLVSLIVTRPLVKRFKKRNKTTETKHGLLNPIQARYQTALHPVNRAVSNQLYYYSGFEGECQQDFAKNIIFAFFRAKRCINPTADA